MMCRICVISFLLITICSTGTILAQSGQPDPKGAFLRSLAMPGWGHFYTGEQNRNRGLAHLGAEAVLIGSYLGLNIRGNRLENDYLTLSKLRAGVDLDGRSRSFRIAVGDFDSLADYNDYQLRTRNWDRLFEDTPENRWEWDSSDNRLRFRDLRQSRDRVRNQLPALAGLMVVNRVISAISSYNRADKNLSRESAQLMVLPVATHSRGMEGVMARLQFNF